MNIIFRRCLGMLNLTEIRRDFYDSEAVQIIQVTLTSDNFCFTNRLFVFISLTATQLEDLAGILDFDSPARRTAVARRGDYFQSVARRHGFGCHGQNSPTGWRFQSELSLKNNPTLNNSFCNVTGGLQSRVGRQGGDDGLQQTYLSHWRYRFRQKSKNQVQPTQGKPWRHVLGVLSQPLQRDHQERDAAYAHLASHAQGQKSWRWRTHLPRSRIVRNDWSHWRYAVIVWLNLD